MCSPRAGTGSIRGAGSTRPGGASAGIGPAGRLVAVGHHAGGHEGVGDVRAPDGRPLLDLGPHRLQRDGDADEVAAAVATARG